MMQRVRVSSLQSPVHKLGHAQMALTPKFRLTFSPNPTPLEESPSTESESELELGPLIPGLPDDVALSCLLRLPLDTHPSCRSVCRRWRHLFASKEHFFTQRKVLGFCDPWLFAFAFHRCTEKIQWLVLDLASLSWHAIPSMPCRDRVCPQGFGCVALPLDGTLLVCGGLARDLDCSLHLVLKYEVVRNRWSVKTRMNNSRSFFASGLIEGRVFVAGGYSADQFELNSAEMFDPAEGRWQQVASMGTSMMCYDSAVLDGRLHVTEGWMWPFLASPIGQVYDPKTDSWEDMAVGLREGWTGPSVVMHGRLFIVSEREGMRVKVYDAKSDSWDVVEGLCVPKRIRKPIAVSTCESRIYVVGRGLRVAVGHVDRLDCVCADGDGTKERFCIEWQEADVAGSRDFCDLTPSRIGILFA